MTRLRGTTVVFDLDGTLVDTAPDLTRAMNHVLESEGVPTLTTENVRPLIGQGAVALIRRGFESAGLSLDASEVERLKTQFLTFYNSNILVDSVVFPAVEDALSELSGDGAVLVVCTNKPQGLSESLLRAIGLFDRFAAIVGADAVPARKPDPGHVHAAVRQGGGSSDRAIFVGDSETDERAARGAGLPFLVYPHGYRSASIEDLAADAVFGDYRELPDLVRRFST